MRVGHVMLQPHSDGTWFEFNDAQVKDLGPDGVGVVFGAPAPSNSTTTATAAVEGAEGGGLPAIDTAGEGGAGGGAGVAPPPLPSTSHSPAKAPGEAGTEAVPATPFTGHAGGGTAAD